MATLFLDRAPTLAPCPNCEAPAGSPGVRVEVECPECGHDVTVIACGPCLADSIDAAKRELASELDVITA